MSHVLARLLCVTAVAALALPVCAQGPQTTPKPTQTAQATGSATGAGASTAMSPEEKAARTACETKHAAEQQKCLKEVDAQYHHKATTDKMAPSGDMAAKPKEDAMKSGSAK